MARAPQKRTAKSPEKKTVPVSTRKTTPPAVNKTAVALERIEREVNVQKKKVADAKQKLIAAKSRATGNATKASQALLKKRAQEVRTHVSKLNNLVSKNTLVKAELRAAKILSQVAEAEEKARARVLAAEKKLEQKTANDLDKAVARYKQSWLKKRTSAIARQVRRVEKNALARVKAIEKRLHKQATDAIKNAEQKINSRKQNVTKTVSTRGPGRPPKSSAATKTPAVKSTARNAKASPTKSRRGPGRPQPMPQTRQKLPAESPLRKGPLLPNPGVQKPRHRQKNQLHGRHLRQRKVRLCPPAHRQLTNRTRRPISYSSLTV